MGTSGTPSSYAYVKFACEPANEPSLDFAVEWPQDFDDVYALRIRNAIAEAILDVFFSRHDTGTIYRGCRLRLTAFQWDNVGGSEAAVYRATAKAMLRLCEHGQWTKSVWLNKPMQKGIPHVPERYKAIYCDPLRMIKN